jgi:hypothetical protein
MYSLITEAQQNIQEYNITGTIGNIGISEDNVIDLEITNQCTDSNEFRLGGVYIGQLTATFANVNIARNSWEGQEISLTVHIGTESIPIGVYTIDTAEHTKGIVDVVAYDHMAKFDKEVNISEGASGSAFDFLELACQQVGVSLGMTRADVEALPNGNQPFVLWEMGDIETWRDLVYWIAVSLGSFATIDRNGYLVVRTFHKNIDDTISHLIRIVGSSYGDKIVGYNTILSYLNESKEYVMASGLSGTETLNIGANPFFQTDAVQVNTYLTNIIGTLSSEIEYAACNVTIPFGWHYDLGDVLQFPFGSGSLTNIFCVMGYSFTYNAECQINGIPVQKNSKNKSDKALQNVSTSSDKDSYSCYEQTNVSAITIGEDTEERILLCRIASNRNTKAEIQIEIDLTTLANVTSKSYTSPFDLEDIFGDISAATTKGIITYLINSVDSLRYPEEIWLDGKHVLHLMYILPVQANSLNTFEVYMKAERGEIFIPRGGAWLYASGAGLVGESGFSGNIDVSDKAADFNLVEIGMDEPTETVSASAFAPVVVPASDVASAFNLVEINIENANDDVIVKNVGQSEPYITEDDNNYITEDGDFYYTEGV